ncbi:MAG: hypothetical protein METHP_00353 [Methanoregula sp. SKADARSKE-2]|nr:MAG: hypothetical protein METHP_00353 [Methanoregula sp. SKADARSKE-2]
MDSDALPGMFSIPLARMIGPSGKVIAVDVQQKMLVLVRKKSENRGLTSRITFYRNFPDSLLTEQADLILSFWMVYEVRTRFGSSKKSGATSDPALNISRSGRLLKSANRHFARQLSVHGIWALPSRKAEGKPPPVSTVSPHVPGDSFFQLFFSVETLFSVDLLLLFCWRWRYLSSGVHF